MIIVNGVCIWTSQEMEAGARLACLDGCQLLGVVLVIVLCFFTLRGLGILPTPIARLQMMLEALAQHLSSTAVCLRMLLIVWASYCLIVWWRAQL